MAYLAEGIWSGHLPVVRYDKLAINGSKLREYVIGYNFYVIGKCYFQKSSSIPHSIGFNTNFMTKAIMSNKPGGLLWISLYKKKKQR
mgnify:CR=1 FL=1